MGDAEAVRVICTNRKARHLYEILETVEAGLAQEPAEAGLGLGRILGEELLELIDDQKDLLVALSPAGQKPGQGLSLVLGFAR